MIVDGRTNFLQIENDLASDGSTRGAVLCTSRHVASQLQKKIARNMTVPATIHRVAVDDRCQ